MRTQVHAAIELLDLAALAKLLNEEARFHFGRKLTDSEVNIFACSCRYEDGVDVGRRRFEGC